MIVAAVQSKDNPADLINVALEELIRARFELPGYSMLDALASSIRAEVNDAVYRAIGERVDVDDQVRLDELLRVDSVTRRSRFDDLKRAARSASVSRLREHLTHLEWLDGLGAPAEWVQGVPPAKVTHFAALARVTDAGDIRDMRPPKRTALIACLLHVAQIRGRDELTTMFCKRVAAIHKQAKDRFEQLRESARDETEQLVEVFGDLLAAVRQSVGMSEQEAAAAEMDPIEEVWQRTGQAVLATLAQGGGVSELSATHERVSAFHGDNSLPFLEKHYRSSRSALFDMLDVLVLTPTTADRAVLDAVAFLKAGRRRTGEFIPDHLDGEHVDLSFASDAWLKILRPRAAPTKLVRRHFEVCVFSYLAAELRAGEGVPTRRQPARNHTPTQQLDSARRRPAHTGAARRVRSEDPAQHGPAEQASGPPHGRSAHSSR